LFAANVSLGSNYELILTQSEPEPNPTDIREVFILVGMGFGKMLKFVVMQCIWWIAQCPRRNIRFTNRYTLENEGTFSAKLVSQHLGPQKHKYLNFLERRIK